MPLRILTLPLAATCGLLWLVAFLLFHFLRLDSELAPSWEWVSPPQLQLAARILAEEPDFAPGPVGPFGATTDQQLAWHRVLASRDVEPIALDLLRERRAPAKLWGLATLRLRHLRSYDAAAAALRGSKELIWVHYGCIPGRTTVGTIVAALDTIPFYANRLLTGNWIDALELHVPSN
jgi:hypothetical protein